MSVAHGGLARTLVEGGEFALAAASFGSAIECAGQPSPLLYNNQTSAVEKAGKPAEALATLDAGIETIGPLVSLVTPAVEMDLAANRFDAARAREDSLLANLPRKDAWLVRRAEILEKAERKTEARATWVATETTSHSWLSRGPAAPRSESADYPCSQAAVGGSGGSPCPSGVKRWNIQTNECPSWMMECVTPRHESTNHQIICAAAILLYGKTRGALGGVVCDVCGRGGCSVARGDR